MFIIIIIIGTFLVELHKRSCVLRDNLYSEVGENRKIKNKINTHTQPTVTN